jgi:hypothetical protein
MNPAIIPMLVDLAKLLADPKTEQAVISLAKQALETGLALRDLFGGEGGAFGAERRAKIAEFNAKMTAVFHEMLQKMLADGVIDDAEHVRLRDANQQFLDGLAAFDVKPA